MDSEAEQQLLSRAQAGDMEALGQLWDISSPKLFGYLVNTLRDKQLAEDVFQSTWLRAAEHIAGYQFRGVGFSSWLFAIARNECRQLWRKSNRAEEHVLQSEPVSHEHETLHSKLLVDQALSKLSESDQELLRLRYIADLSINEIAKTLNSNSVAVRVRVSRALARVRTVINTSHV